MEGEKDIRKYVTDTTTELVENYKDLIKKTFEVTDKDLLQDKIDNEATEESEEKYLTAIKKRRVALDEVDLMLDKIDKLNKRICADDDENTSASEASPAKKYSKK